MNAEETMAQLRLEFGDLSPDLDTAGLQGFLYLEIGQFARYTRQAIDHGDRRLVDQCFAFARRAALDGDDEVVNAIGVSYIEHLNFDDGKVPRQWAYRRLPQPLRSFADSLGVQPLS